MRTANTIFGFAILLLIAAGGGILFNDINNRFQPHVTDGQGPNPTVERSHWRFPER